jgi:ubiquinol-cytochrome c reductase cytochrome b subunit
VRSAHYRPLYRQFYLVLISRHIGLGWLGSQPAEGAYGIARACFAYTTSGTSWSPAGLGLFETPKPRPASLQREPFLRRQAA